MKLLMKKNAFSPEAGKKTRTVHLKGTVVEETDANAQILIDKGYAEPFKPEKDAEPQGDESEPKKSKKSKDA
jgi:hypothetical protein